MNVPIPNPTTGDQEIESLRDFHSEDSGQVF